MTNKVDTNTIRVELKAIEELTIAHASKLKKLASSLNEDDILLQQQISETFKRWETLKKLIRQHCTQMSVEVHETSAEEVVALLEEKLSLQVTWKNRLESIASFLDKGEVKHRMPKKQSTLTKAKDEAVTALRNASLGHALEFSGPHDAQEWFNWWWALCDGIDEVLEEIRNFAESFALLLENMEQSHFIPPPRNFEEKEINASEIKEAPATTHKPTPPVEQAPKSLTKTPTEQPIKQNISNQRKTEPAPQKKEAPSEISARLTKHPNSPIFFSESPKNSILEASKAALPSGEQRLTLSGPTENSPHPNEETTSPPFDSSNKKASFLGNPSPPSLPKTVQPAPSEKKASQPTSQTKPSTKDITKVQGPPEPNPIQTFPKDLARFEIFRDRHYINSDGVCELAPWQPSHVEELQDRLGSQLENALSEKAFWKAWVFSSAMEKIEVQPHVQPKDLETVNALWQAPGRDGSSSAQRSELLRSKIANKTTNPSPFLRLTLLLTALYPDEKDVFSHPTIEKFIEQALFLDKNLQTVTEGMLKVVAMGESSIDFLLKLTEESKRLSDAELAKKLKNQRKELHSFIRENWSAAGGRIRTTHCRHAWSLFINKVVPKLEVLYPPDEGGQEKWDISGIEHIIQTAEKVYKRIADKAEAKLTDRKVMDSAARQMFELAAQINRSMRLITNPRLDKNKGILNSFPQKEFFSLLKQPPEDPLENICYQTLLYALQLEAPQKKGILNLSARNLIEYIELLPFVEQEELAACPRRIESIEEPILFEATSILHPLRAAAVLFHKKFSEADLDEKDIGKILYRAVQNSPREDLARWLLPLLDDADAKKVRAQIGDEDDDLSSLQQEIRAVWGELDALGSQDAAVVWELCESAQKLITRDEKTADCVETPLLRAWLRGVKEQAKASREGSIEFLKEQSKTEGTKQTENNVLEALNQRRFSDALRLVTQQTPVKHERSVRETEWRTLAEKKYGNPLSSLKKLSREFHSGEPTGDFLKAWLEGVTSNSQKDQKITRLFVEFILSGLSLNMPQRDNNAPKVRRLTTRALRDSIAERNMNPCFLPQLSSFETIVFTTPKMKVSNARFETELANFLSDYKGHLTLCLCPQITERVRNDSIALLRKRGLRAAIIDDFDILRLFNLSGSRPDPILGCLELALEQQPWREVDPFEASDGQHVKMEMYVGRQREAGWLSHTARYSRLFSGRKLGKSALLRYVTEASNRTLPSGNKLHVLFIPIVGAQSEQYVVESIFEKLREQLSFKIELRADEPPKEALVRELKKFLRENPENSLLIVLDEADVFVEQQIQDYQKNRERCLAFQIRTAVEAEKDRNDFPRIRFLFSGYRTTNTQAGAWANWGDVLILEPLEPEHAASLIAGPLARLGIDATNQAADIAHRCGYQPAVLLKFGRVLLEILGAEHQKEWTKTLTVSPHHVSRAFNHPSVREEIRTIVRNNFQGYPEGSVTFNMILAVFSRFSPGATLHNLPERLLEQKNNTKELASKLQSQDEESTLGRFTVILNDLVQRHLLVEERHGSSSLYRLRFPHHLPVLLEKDPMEMVRKQAMTSEFDVFKGETYSQQALLSESLMIELRSLLGEPSTDFPVQAVVVCSSWVDSLSHPCGGLPDLLGVKTPQPGKECLVKFHEKQIHIVDQAKPDRAEVLLKEWSLGSPPPLLLGDVELLRWALKHRDAADEFLIELLPPGRMPKDTVSWWFSRVCGLEFSTYDALDRLYKVTRGIPLLVGLLYQKILPSGSGGVTIGPERLEKALAAFLEEAQTHLREYAQKLVTREKELLEMVVSVSRFFDGGGNLEEALNSYEEISPQKTYTPFGPGDLSHLELLHHLGLLQTTPSDSGTLQSRLSTLHKDDPICLLFAEPSQT